MNAHQVKINNQYPGTTMHGCDCPNFQRTGGGYIFHNFLTGETMVGCKHMFDIYVQQGKDYMANQAQKMEYLTQANNNMEIRTKKAILDRIDAEQRLEDALAEVRILTRKLNVKLEAVGV